MSNRLFEITSPKPQYAQWYVDIDLTEWLDGENISNVVFSAIETSTGIDASDKILDPLKNIYTTKKLRPYISNGESGKSYLVTMKFITDKESQDEFYLKLRVA